MEEKQISTFGKILAGTLLIFFTASAIYLIIGFWPDKMPLPNGCSLYENKLFNVKLLKDCNQHLNADSATKNVATSKVIDSTKDLEKKDSLIKINTVKSKDTAFADTSNNQTSREQTSNYNCEEPTTIELNTLLLILVALSGFLGNMIHIGTSFTTFIGMGTYKKSWLLWYLVRPFTASALAIAFYFVLRGGFLNYSNDAGNINIYGVLSFSMLVGLFTDIATQKLKEIFQAAFNPKDKRTDTLYELPQISSVVPDKIDKAAITTIILNGKNLDQKLVLKMNGELITNAVVKPEVITIQYTIPATQNAAADFKLEISDKDGKPVYAKTFVMQ